MQAGLKYYWGLSLAFGLVTYGNTQSLTWLGVPSGNSSVATTVSDDGKIVVGRSGDILSGSPNVPVYLWNLHTNTTTPLTSVGGTAFGLTPNGAKVAGMDGYQAFIWTPSGGRVILPGMGGYHWAICLTPDGALAGGGAYVGGPPNYPALWDVASTPPQLLRVYNNRGYSGEIWDLSDDASVALCFTVSDTYRARIWRMNGLNIQQDITLPPFGSDPYTLGYRLSSDGSVAVGISGQISNMWVGVGSNYRPAMWRAANNWQVEPLATLGGVRGVAWDVNAGVIVGFCSTPSDENRAVRWQLNAAATQVEDLNVAYASLLTNGSRLRIAYGISRNGRFIVGSGYNAATGRTEAFLLDTQSCTPRDGDADANGCVDDADLLTVLFNFGQTGQNSADLNCDSVVDDADLLIVLFNFGQGC
ncbi:MAG: hypothetical protein N2554_09130 [Fimbriimonadales bacterium]|nr:hypothetical protein [Fimbriimonadales bacterium]